MQFWVSPVVQFSDWYCCIIYLRRYCLENVEIYHHFIRMFYMVTKVHSTLSFGCRVALLTSRSSYPSGRLILNCCNSRDMITFASICNNERQLKQFWSLAECKMEGGRPGKFITFKLMSDINVYLVEECSWFLVVRTSPSLMDGEIVWD